MASASGSWKPPPRGKILHMPVVHRKMVLSMSHLRWARRRWVPALLALVALESARRAAAGERERGIVRGRVGEAVLESEPDD